MKEFKTTIGGQALIEGVLMKGPSKTSMAIRKPNGEIHVEVQENFSLGEKYPFLELPFLRGVVRLIEAMVMGIHGIFYSASFQEEPEESFFQKKFPKYGEKLEEAFTLLLSVGLSVLLFLIVPNFITSLITRGVESSLGKNLVEGILRFLLFFGYLIFVSRQEDLKRVFEYHGAEHKSIACYEHGAPLEVREALAYSRLHPRCGTSFLFTVFFLSVFLLAFFGWPSPLMRLVIRLLMLPVIAGISYEVNRLVGKYDNPITRALRWPGLMIQRLATVREPSEAQLEVGLAALKAVLPQEGEEDQWK
ncbi:MAG: DUF1385 domain-containing protein [Tissierellia bacterium]|nr:DUF1385 domain-containing protein [Tissierellia bacterium]